VSTRMRNVSLGFTEDGYSLSGKIFKDHFHNILLGLHAIARSFKDEDCEKSLFGKKTYCLPCPTTKEQWEKILEVSENVATECAGIILFVSGISGIDCYVFLDKDSIRECLDASVFESLHHNNTETVFLDHHRIIPNTMCPSCKHKFHSDNPIDFVSILLSS